MSIEAKIAHLGFVQGVINRMGNNSFLIKGWVVALTAAIFALSAEKANINFIYLAFFPLIFFWWLDAFFLHQEKLYRKLYEKIANDKELSDYFTMDVRKYKSEVECLCKVIFSKIIVYFYCPILFMIILFMLKNKCFIWF